MSASGDSSLPGDFSIVYRTYSLMPPHVKKVGDQMVTCDQAFVLRLDGSGAVVCGWEGGCPREEKRQPRPPVAAKQLARLKALVEKSGFFSLREFNRNPNIIDGGMEELEVHAGRRKKRVQMANTEARPFTQIRDELLLQTGCSYPPSL